ncbi:hypothetical protein LOD99_996 [Oopsacas minuta]|uniref:DNA-(apurinic or apyrimidinic site) lyase n=1 Tax=Oopsacas minuta TaxID=111878 RepID=A0AAV7K0J1_9METZ|nr:hypothetical protein LOD99_996 [Oopsacas minuta]
MSSGWKSIVCKQTDLYLEAVLQCGQAFGWRKNEEGTWFGVLKDHVFLLKQSESSLLYKTLPSTQIYSDSEEVLLDYFRLREDMSSCYEQWSERDERFRDTHQIITGIRILRQDPVECIFSFICSSANNTLRISQLVLKLAQHFGKEIALFEDVPCHSFPRIEDLSRKGVREKLVSLGFGYRSRYIYETAIKLRDEYSRDWLVSLREIPYKDAVESLLQFPGIGRKVADCVCLMSLDKLEAVPMDTHAIQIANRDYGLKLNSKSISKTDHQKAGNYFRDLYGDRAGWAQTILFVRELKVVNKLYQDVSSSASKTKRRRYKQDNTSSDEKKVKLA